jgi:hypothetical protein
MHSTWTSKASRAGLPWVRISPIVDSQIGIAEVADLADPNGPISALRRTGAVVARPDGLTIDHRNVKPRSMPCTTQVVNSGARQW